ncbi:50S ribosomal protein L24 [Candidatus Nitrosacidococcus tergens]|uniref:Large ribosomal subunit protein uL24 n=1 Tax=Candidatus Nitrosacidococcus tergens TaxID=553981 RepID=A0A7G1Q883_9GAMM|nr:50S ribosomal protein L24 [Candidatus Nitrosacidococcus tergens]CAB1274829.1 50S ribosomal subunit protein L24 [Candidatus Nitrosacidococcus tergens]
MRRIKRNDQIIVISGKDKGKLGKVLRILDNNYIVVEGINLLKKHKRPNMAAGDPGGILEKEGSIHISNVMIYDAMAGRGSRVGFKEQGNNRKVRYLKTSGESIDL